MAWSPDGKWIDGQGQRTIRRKNRRRRDELYLADPHCSRCGCSLSSGDSGPHPTACYVSPADALACPACVKAVREAAGTADAATMT